MAQNGKPLGNMVIQLGLDSTTMNDSLTKAQNQLKNFERQVKAQKGLSDYYKTGTNAAKAFQLQKENLNKAIQTQSQLLQKLKKDYDAEAKENGEMSKKAQRLAGDIELGNAKLASYHTQLKEVDKTAKQYEQERIDSIEKEAKARRDNILNIRDEFEKYAELQGKIANISKTGPGASKAYAEQLQSMNKAIASHSDYIKQLEKDYKEEVKVNGEATAKAEELHRELKSGKAQLRLYQEELKAISKDAHLASNKLNLFGDKLSQFSTKAHNWESGLNTVSQRTQALSLAIFGGMTLSAKAAMDFESAFAGVKKTVDETDGWSYDRLASEIRKMSQELPASAVEISKVAEAAGQLGIKTEDIMSFTRVMIDLGESTNMTAEEASVALAKFKNITQMPAEDFKKLGDVIVQLGNNMATTEQDIVDMSLRLASSGKLAGLNEAQIMALAATLSSVGMEAEAGGSAMSRVMQKLNTAVAEGEAALDKFAAVAGMSAEDFANKWKSEPQDAIVDFLNGLRRVKEEGGDVTQTLKNMKISNIRDIDTLQRLAGAGDLLAHTLSMANEEWANGNALQTEAQKRYETTESKMKMARNKINDIAITLGGPLLDAFLDTLDAADPLVDNVADMAKRFSELDEVTQRNIINWALALGAISPVSKILGSTIGTVGDLAGGIGTLSKKVANIGAENAGKAAIEALGATAGTTATSVGGLTGAVGLLGSPVTWGVLATGAALVGLTVIVNQMGEAEQRAREWGVAVDKVQAEELQRFKDKVDSSTRAMDEFGTGGVENLDKVKQSFTELADVISEGVDKENQELAEMAKKFGLTDEQIAHGKSQNDRVAANARAMVDEVVAIYERHNNDRTKLSAEEKAIVLNNQTELINAQLDLMKYSGKEREELQKAMNGQIDELGREQQQKALNTIGKWLEDEKKLYETSKNELARLRDEGYLDEAAYREKLSQLESEYLIKTETYKTKYAELSKKLFDSMTFGSGGMEENTWKLMVKNMEQLGIDYDEMVSKIEEGSHKIGEANSLIALSSIDMSDDAKAANLAWNLLVFDEKTGDVKTNAKEEIQKALEAENGWANMQFVLKHANLTTNAKLTIAEVLASTGQWDSLSPEDKELVVDNSKSIKNIFDSQSLLNQWNALTPDQKKLVAQDLTANPTMSAQAAIDSVSQKTIPTISVIDNATPTLDGIIGKLAAIAQGTVAKATAAFNKHETGTNFHPGGLAMVNDQAGSLYKELVTLPSGESFIPQGRNIVLDLPRGTKVLRASSTENLMRRLGIPKYADGIGIPEDARIFSDISRARNHLNAQSVNVTVDNKELVFLLSEILSFLRQKGVPTGEGDIYMDGSKVGRKVTEWQKQTELLENMMRGV